MGEQRYEIDQAPWTCGVGCFASRRRLKVNDDDRFVPALEARAGLEWVQDFGFGEVAIAAGWEGQFWFQVGSAAANEGASEDSDDFQDQRDADLSFNGGFVRISLRR